jgi:hypothetical protein
MLQNLIVKILQLDRENQQALLRRGLVPARHVTACAAPPSNYVANLYRRHTTQNPESRMTKIESRTQNPE